MTGGVTAAAFAALGAATVLACWRLLRGPGLADRVVALDLITYLAIGLIVVHALETRQSVYLDAAIVLALVAFLGTVAFARYLEREHHRKEG